MNRKLKEIENTLNAYMQLMRIKNCIIVFFAMFIPAVITLGEFSISTKIVLAASVAFMVTAAGNAFNDYYDYVIDKINRPDRPIPSGRVKRSDAMMLSFTLFLVGIAISYRINIACFLIAVTNVIVLMIYARYSKKMPIISNFVVSYLIASVFIFSGVAASETFAQAKPIFVLSSCAFLITFSREIIKDIEDIKGDLENNSETLPILIGEEKAKQIAIVFSLSAVLLSFLPYAFGLVNNVTYYLILIIIADLIFIYSLLKTPKESQKIMVMGMVMALVAFFVSSVL